jgi:4-amino-4-deoxy-L-arabinose transferase-like glycosyltransferase
MKLVQDRKLQLSAIFVAALVVRLCAMFFLETYRFPDEESFGYGYGATAKQVALGEGFSLAVSPTPLLDYESGAPRATAVAPPGYVYFLALIFSLFGIYSIKAAIIVEVIQSLTAAFTCVVFYDLGRKFNENVGLLAALAMALYPPSIMFSIGRISPVILVVLLLGLIMHYLLKIQETLRYRDAVICGLFMGLTALFEPSVILFYIAACAWLFLWSANSRAAALKCSLIMGLVCIVCLFPWTIRNYKVFGEFPLLKSSMGFHLLVGNNPYCNGVTFYCDDFNKVFSTEELRELQQLDEVQVNKIMHRKAISFIKDNPKMFLESTLKRIYYYWSPVNPYRTTRYESLRIVFYGPVLILAALGVVLTRKKWRETSLLLALFLSQPLFYYVTQVTINRYRYAVEAFLILLASYALVNLFERFRWPSSVFSSGAAQTRLKPAR